MVVLVASLWIKFAIYGDLSVCGRIIQMLQYAPLQSTDEVYDVN